MRIAQFLERGGTRLGIIEQETLIPLEFHGDIIDFLQGPRSFKVSGSSLPLNRIRFAPAVSRPSKIIGIGLNYLDHITESKGTRIPKNPIIFAKFPNSLLAHKEEITWHPDLTNKVDFEAELAVVIGKKATRLSEKEAIEAVFGYTCANDVSARDIQFGDKQWVRGKTLDTFCPIGPWIVTADEIVDPQALGIKSLLNGDIMQNSDTGKMIFKLPQLISFLSMNMTLFPGDIILTGTPNGVGTFRDPPIYMKKGDEIVVEIEQVGRLVNTCTVSMS